jgi:protein O-mannosyl-transferase
MSQYDEHLRLNTPLLEEFVAKPGIAETIVAASALLAYIATLTFGFVYDDVLQIVQNPAIREWGSTLQYFHQDVWAGIGTQGAATFFRPVFMLWIRLNDALFGLQPSGWHAAAVVLHVIASILVCRVAGRLTESRAAACAVGMLFALHPVHVESVAWVSGATDPLMTVFVCGAVLSYLEFSHGGKYRFLAWSVVLACLALLTKETAVLLPLLLGASLLTHEGGWKPLKAAKSLLIFVLLAGLYLILRQIVLHGPPPIANMTVGQMIMTWPVVLVFYLGELMLPWRLSLFRDFFAVQSASEPRFLGALVLTFAIAAALFWWARSSSRRGLIVTACAWLLVPLLPVLNLRVLIPGQLVPDRYLYLPSVGFSLLVVAAGMDFAERFDKGPVWRFRSSLVLAISLMYVFVVFVNQRVWASNLLFFKHSVEIAPPAMRR